MAATSITAMSKILAITGGVGGAKLALGLSKVLASDELLFAVNTGDDFDHLGLHISPDIDSLTYALAEENNQELGWGRQGETWQFIESLEALGGESWFRLGDKDMALHTQRTQLLNSGASLSDATASITQALNIAHTVAPMTNTPVRTIVHSDQGDLAFQHYFVREQCQPAVTGFSFNGLADARLNPVIENWLERCTGVIICPSNPYVSVDPLLKLNGFAERLTDLPVVAISPIVGGLAIKGPAAKMMAELDVPASAYAVAQHYEHHYPGLMNGYIVDKTDEKEASRITDGLRIPTIATNSIMVTLQDRVDLAHTTLGFLRDLTP
ncbi:MAG: 2-phospho-L-lactate transferase CofD family protein [Pseudomonadales bacterium]|nr:2-phospho-L-lactate transferase CofD family protein [Pseudomonadales bacterium]